MTIRKQAPITVCPTMKGRTKSGGYIIYSHDVNSAQFILQFTDESGESLDLINATPTALIVLHEEDGDRTIILNEFEIISLVDGEVGFTIPENVMGFTGKCDMYIYLDFADGSSSDEVHVSFAIEKSLIDDAYVEAGDYYIAEFETILDEVEEKAADVLTRLEEIAEIAPDSTGVDDFTNAPAFFEKGTFTNLFDKDTITAGAFVNNSNEITTNANFAYSDYIKIKPNTAYSVPITFSAPGCYYDKDKNFITCIENDDKSNNNNKTFTTPSNASYVRLNCYPERSDMSKGSSDFFSLVEGTVANSVPIIYGVKPKWLTGHSRNLIGKKMVTFGDSITWYDNNPFVSNSLLYNKRCVGYQTYLRSAFDCGISNQGISGQHSGQIMNRSFQFDYSTYELALFFMGVNDFGSERQAGELLEIGGDFNRYTLIGAYQAMIEDILTRSPQTKIGIIVPYKVWNTQVGGLMPRAYVDGIMDVAKLYSIPYLNLYDEAQLNELNRDYYFVDDQTKVPYYYHLNNKGYELISRKIVHFVDSIMG